MNDRNRNDVNHALTLAVVSLLGLVALILFATLVYPAGAVERVETGEVGR